MNPFHVEWDRSAELELARIWLRSSDPNSITAATARADQLLARDPIGNGRHISEGLYQLRVPPLVLSYSVDTARRIVEVSSVWSRV
jgi:hypothetical protein